MLRAFPSTILKNLAFTISKTNFITYNKSLYNIPSIKTSIFFFTFHLNIISLLFFIHIFILSLSLSLSLSTQLFLTPLVTASTHPYHNHHIHPPSPPLATNQIHRNHKQQQRKKRKKNLHIHRWTKKKSIAIEPNHHQPQQEK